MLGHQLDFVLDSFTVEVSLLLGKPTLQLANQQQSGGRPLTTSAFDQTGLVRQEHTEPIEQDSSLAFR
jgi:hypothetical protein